MKKLLFIAAASVLYACGGGDSHDHSGHDHEGHDHEGHAHEATQETNITMYGTEFDTTGAVSILALANNLEGGQTEGVYKTKIVESCQKMGCWMKVDHPAGEPLMVYMNEHAFFVPKTGVSGLDCYIQGTAYYDTVSVDMQKHYLEDANAPQEEIDAITEEKYELAFNATGVVIEGYVPSEEEATEGDDHDHDHDHDHGTEEGESEEESATEA